MNYEKQSEIWKVYQAGDGHLSITRVRVSIMNRVVMVYVVAKCTFVGFEKLKIDLESIYPGIYIY